jgi:hypothetical protein
MAVTYNSYFNKLPKINYDINGSRINSKFENVTNIFFRIKYVTEVINNISSYYTLEVDDGDTPEILAEKVYGDAGAGWMIILANEMIDPQFEWPLDSNAFRKYIIDKYGSVELAETTTHHFEMVVSRSINGQPPVEFRYSVGQRRLTKNALGVPHNYYEPYFNPGLWRYPEVEYSADSTQYTSDRDGQPFADADQDKYSIDESIFTIDQPELTADLVLGREGNYLANGSLSFGQTVNTYEFNDDTIVEIVKGEEITNYQYEDNENEKKRLIKVIKKEYYEKVLSEFDFLTGYSPSFLRQVR